MTNVPLPFEPITLVAINDGPTVSDERFTHDHLRRQRVEALIQRIERTRRQLALLTTALKDEVGQLAGDGR